MPIAAALMLSKVLDEVVTKRGGRRDGARVVVFGQVGAVCSAYNTPEWHGVEIALPDTQVMYAIGAEVRDFSAVVLACVDEVLAIGAG